MPKVAIEIEAYRKIDPEHVFASGQVFEIMHTVCDALAYGDSETPLGPRPKAKEAIDG